MLRGTPAADVIRGLGGADRLIGYRGNDRLVGRPAAPTYLLGGPGADRHEGGQGNDRIVGGPATISCSAAPGPTGSRAARATTGSTRATASATSSPAGAGRDTVLKDATRSWRPGLCIRRSRRRPIAAADREQAVILTDEPWRCRGKVDLDLVRVTMRTTVDDAIRLDQNCSGRVGRVEIETWTADGIKVQNRGTVAHDLVIESGYVKCHDVAGEYHQDGIQVMGGYRLTFKNLADRLPQELEPLPDRAAARRRRPRPTSICDGCVLGPNSAQTLFYAPSLRSGAREHHDLHRPLPRDPDRARRRGSS